MEEKVNQANSEAEVQTEQPGKDDRGLTILLLVVAIVAVLALVGWLAMQRFNIPNPFAPAPAPTVTSEPPPAAATSPLAVQATPTPTRVIADAQPSPTAQPVAPNAGAAVEAISVPVTGERVSNGSFENGFGDQNIGLDWTGFHNGAAVVEFIEESWPPAVFDGERAQRIQVREASQPDRHAGIYQTVGVAPGETYELTLHGQIRSGEGDIRVSQYGYRLQLGIDESGGQDWTAVEDWIELPWDEQRFDSDFLFFYDYTTPVIATSPYLTIFIRTWNKWPDPGRVEYTLDAISLIGPTPSGEIAVDKALPVTGDLPLSMKGWIRVLASVLVLCLLVAGAIWQVRRQLG